MEGLAQTAIEHTTRFVQFSGGDAPPETTASVRAAFAWLLHVGPLLNRELHEAFTRHRLYGPLVMYERVHHAFGSLGADYFLNGVPASVLLIGVPASVGLPSGDVAHHTAQNALLDRSATAQKLKNIAPHSVQAQQLSHAHAAPDLPAQLPMKVRVLVSRARAVHNALRDAEAACQLFRQCEHAECARLFCGRAPPRQTEAHPVPYLRSLGLTCRDADLPERFCSLACATQWIQQAAAASPHPEKWLPPILPAIVSRPTPRVALTKSSVGAVGAVGKPHSARARAAAELRSALRRNENFFCTQLRAARKRRFPALGGPAVRIIRQELVDALNVDTAALFLGVLLLESSQLRSDSLPGTHTQWRTTDAACEIARRIRMLRDEGGALIRPESADPSSAPLLRRVRANALRLAHRLVRARSWR
jgi:hypothetical protein